MVEIGEKMAISEDFASFINQLKFYTRKMELEFTCPCCSNMLEMPTELPCSHKFCRQCIIITKDNLYKCPSCQSCFFENDLRHSTYMDKMKSTFKCMEVSMSSLFQQLHSPTDISGPGRPGKGLDGHRSVATATCVQPPNSSTVARNESIERNSQEKDAIEETKENTKDEELQADPVNSRIQRSSPTIKDVSLLNTGSITRSMKRKMERMHDSEPNNQSSLPSRNSSSPPQINNTTSPKHSMLEEDCSILDRKSTDEMRDANVTTPRGETSLKESCVAVQNKGDVATEGLSTMPGPSHAGVELNSHQSGISGMEICPKGTTVMTYYRTKKKSKECNKTPALSGTHNYSIDVTTVKKEAKAMLHLLETSNSKMKHAGPTTNNTNSAVPSSPPCTSTFRKPKKLKLISEILDSKPVSPEQCVLENKCNELKRKARGKCKGWMLCESCISKSEEELLVKFASLTGAPFTKCYKRTTTHLIVSTDSKDACRTTIKVLKAILNGQWILKVDWIKDCMKEGRVVSEKQYEVSHVGIGNRIYDFAPMRGRLCALNKTPKIMSGTRFFFANQFTYRDKNTWEDLVKDAGATVLRENDLTLPGDRSSTYIVFNEAYEEKWTEDQHREVIKQRAKQVVELKVKTNFQIIGHTGIIYMIAEFAFAEDLKKHVVV